VPQPRPVPEERRAVASCTHTRCGYSRLLRRVR
jgi:hypothetical protein